MRFLLLSTGAKYDSATQKLGLFFRRDKKRSGGETSTRSDLRKLTLKITGIHCSGCASSIKGFLKGREGVVKAEIDSSGRGLVLYDPDHVEPESILASPIFREPSFFRAEFVEDALA